MGFQNKTKYIQYLVVLATMIKRVTLAGQRVIPVKIHYNNVLLLLINEEGKSLNIKEKPPVPMLLKPYLANTCSEIYL